jgi:hypothetical protein
MTDTKSGPEQRLHKARLVIEKWNGLIKTLKDLEGTTLALMRHPDATPEMILLAAEQYRKAYVGMDNAEPRVFAAVPSTYHYRLTPLTRRDK